MYAIFLNLFIAVLASIILCRYRPKILRPDSRETFQPPASIGLFDEQPRAPA